MTTDYTSATINQNVKTAAAQNRTFKFANNSTDTGMFDSVFENVSKNYADKSEVKASKSPTDYAKETKSVNSAKKENKTTVKNKNNHQQINNQTEKNSAYNQQTEITKQNNLKTKNAETVNVEKAPNSQKNNVAQENENTPAETSFFKNQNTETTVKPETRETIADSEQAMVEKTELNAKIYETETKAENVPEQQAEQSLESGQQIINEQILANVIYEQKLLELTNTQETPAPQEELTDLTEDEDSDEPKRGLLLNQNLQTVTTTNENAIEIPTQDLLTSMQNAAEENVLTLNPTEKAPAQEQLQTGVKQTETQVKNSTYDKIVSDDNLDVDTNNVNLTKLENQKINNSVQERMASDNSRILLNLDEETPVQNTSVLTPKQTKEQVAENIETPLVQVTDEVAQSLKTFTENVQNRDLSGKVKDKVTAKLGELLGTSTVVTEVKNSQQFESGLNSNSQGNSLTQGNAAEQTIRMAVENATETEITADSFVSQLEAKLNASKTVTLKPSENLNLNKADVMNQINSKFNEMTQTGQNKVSIILRPENLGRVAVEIMNTKEGIIAKMTADNQQVKELLNKNIEALRANLSAQGVNINNIKVESLNQSENNAMDFARQQFDQNQQNSQDGQNSGTKNSNNTEQKAFWDNLSSPEESEETTEQQTVQHVETTKTIVTENGKINYKV